MCETWHVGDMHHITCAWLMTVSWWKLVCLYHLGYCVSFWRVGIVLGVRSTVYTAEPNVVGLWVLMSWYPILEILCYLGCIGEVLGGALRCLTSFAALTLMFLVRMLRSLSFQKLKTSLAPAVGSYTPSRHVMSMCENYCMDALCVVYWFANYVILGVIAMYWWCWWQCVCCVSWSSDVPLCGSLQNVLSVWVGPVRSCVRVYPLPVYTACDCLALVALRAYCCLVSNVIYICITSPPLFLCLRSLWRVVGCFAHETRRIVSTCVILIFTLIWDTGSNLVMSELFIVVICYVVVCLIAAISLLYSSIIYISLWRGCIVMLMGCINSLHCWSGSVRTGVRRVAYGI